MMTVLKRFAVAAMSAVVICTSTALFVPEGKADDSLLAFPGAEGGGKYTTGARGEQENELEVFHVTTLEDNGNRGKPTPGSLREAVSKGGRIVVFDVSGVIHLKSKLWIGSPEGYGPGGKAVNNITILGQTAPGDGITISDYDAEIMGDNIIIRYLKIRPTDQTGEEPDGIGGRWKHNIIMDHCSMSWSVDELLTLYAGSLESDTNVSKNITVQYCLASESMRMSNHIKGAHGYGGIIGGTEATYSHNLFAHHDSRSPRFDRNLKSTDFVNNVIYDWGNTNSMYGGEPYSYSSNPEFSTPEYASNINIRNNYFKYGPSTRPAFRWRIFDVTNDGKVMNGSEVLKSNFYINGNHIDGNDAATTDNIGAANTINNKEMANFLGAPVDMNGYDIDMRSAEDAYDTVLNNVGATLPRRDEIDARIVADVRNGTGRVINTDEEVGSLSGIREEERVFEIPQEWKDLKGMGSAADADFAPSGYTWIEEYVNEWTDEQNASAPTNPDITVKSPAVASMDVTYDKINNAGFWMVADENTPVSYKASASAKDGTQIAKMELWDGTSKIETYDGTAEIDDSISLGAGAHYLMSKAYNNLGEVTQSPVSIVYVTGADGKTITEIGSVPYPGKSRVWTNDGKTYIAGSGLINKKSDACSFYSFETDGDFEFSCKVEDIPKYENSTQAGIMFRETLDANSRMIMVSDLWRKYGENIEIVQRPTTKGDAKFIWLQDETGSEIANNGSYDSSEYPVPKYMKIARTGDTLTVSVSDDGVDWKNNVRQPMEFDIAGWNKNAYIGLAVDSVNGDAKDVTHPPLAWFTIASFSDIKMGEPKTPCVKITAEYNGDGSLKKITSIENTFVEEAGRPVLTGLNKVFIWDALDSMKPIKFDAD